MKSTYLLPFGKTVNGLTASIQLHLSSEKGMETQILQNGNGDFIIQARSRGGKATQWIGIDKAVSVRLETLEQNYVEMEISHGKWAEKSLLMIVSLFTLWPLFFTSLIGMCQQGALPRSISKCAHDYVTC